MLADWGWLAVWHWARDPLAARTQLPSTYFHTRVPHAYAGVARARVVYFPNKLSMFMRRTVSALARSAARVAARMLQHSGGTHTLYYFTIQLFGKLHYAQASGGQRTQRRSACDRRAIARARTRARARCRAQLGAHLRGAAGILKSINRFY